MFSTVVIAIVGVALLIATVIPGVRLYWPHRGDPVSRTDLGVALMTGAFIAFAVLGLQLMIQIRSQLDANRRDAQERRAALLLVLGRSSDLSGLDLHKEDLRDAYLNAKILRGAILTGAHMERASLQDAKLVAADLQGANLSHARLERADLRHADLTGVNLEGAKLNNVNLDTAVFYGAKGGADLTANLTGANLSDASVRADLRHANLFKAILVGARLADANLEGADLTHANLDFADLRGADLRGANLGRAWNLHKARDLMFAVYDRTTRWPSLPSDLEPPACVKAQCVVMKWNKVSDFPPEVENMRALLAKAIRRSDCLPGWWVDERSTKITAHAPRNEATFAIGTYDGLKGMSAQIWASQFMSKSNVRPIPDVAMRIGTPSTYAEELDRGDEGRPQRALAVYIVQGNRGFILTATTSTQLFSLYEREFVTLFHVLGVTGDLFPTLRGSNDGCAG